MFNLDDDQVPSKVIGGEGESAQSPKSGLATGFCIFVSAVSLLVAASYSALFIAADNVLLLLLMLVVITPITSILYAISCMALPNAKVNAPLHHIINFPVSAIPCAFFVIT